jgi:hypothetical protein
LGNIFAKISSIESSLLENKSIENILSENNITEKNSIENSLLKSNLIENNSTEENKRDSLENNLIESTLSKSSVIGKTLALNSLLENIKETSSIENIPIKNSLLEINQIESSNIENFSTDILLIDKTSITTQEEDEEIINTKEIIMDKEENSFNNINSEFSDILIEKSFDFSESNKITDFNNNYTDQTIFSSVIIKENKFQLDKCHIDINLLIDNYNINNEILELEYLENCSIIYYCYSSNTDMDSLFRINSKLTFINLKACKNSLINNNLLDEDSDLLIIGKQNLNHSNLFEYDLYENNGNKINNLSVCDNSKIEMISPIDDSDIYDKALALDQQGYDIFNLSSSFYYDICLPVYLNNSDVTLNVRQNDIKPKENSICLDGCIYNGVNLTTKRISCLCDMDFYKQNETKDDNIMEEVDENFFSYILNMINYKIIKCYRLFSVQINYYQNYGFYIGTSIFFIIFLLFIIYLINWSKTIKIKYLRKEPNNKEKLLGLNNDSNNISDNPSNSGNMIDSDTNINKKSFSLFNNDNNNKLRIKSRKCRAHKKNKNKVILELNPPIKKNETNKRKKKSHKNIFKDKTINDINLENIINKESTNIIMKKNFVLSDEKMKKQDKIQINTKDINSNKKNKKLKEDGLNIDYNELTFNEAMINDKRNIIKMFVSYFNSKLDIIQIIFFPNEFSHISLTFSSYLFELLLDLTLNALLFSDDVISQKYYNNGDLLFITSNILSIASNIITSLIIYLTSNLIKYEATLETALKETNNKKIFFQIFVKIYYFIKLKIRIFYSIVLIISLLCIYYLFIFFAIFKKIQKNLFVNYIIGIVWGLGYKVVFCLIITILRKISLIKRYKRLYLIAKFIDDKF